MKTPDCQSDHHDGYFENVIYKTAIQVGPSDGLIFCSMMISGIQYDHHGVFLENVSQTACQAGPSDGFIFVQIVKPDSQLDHHDDYLEMLSPKPLVRLDHQASLYLYK